MTLKVKLLSLIAMICLVAGIMIVGIFSAQTQQIKLNGQVNFEIGDKSLYVKDVRLQENMDTSTIYSLQDSGRFMPGYVNGEFNMNLGDFTNTYGSFALYFDIINTIDETSGETFEYTASSSTTQSGVTVTTTILDSNDSSITQIPQGTIKPSEITPSSPISATIKLTISGTEGANIDLSGITITISEYIPPITIQVTSVSSSGATNNTYNDLAGQYVDSSLDLSGITFNTGETTLTVSMTSLNANYIKNKVSWVNTSGVTISSTSLYLPKNPSEQLTSGESKDLTITVNNTGSPTTISGLEVEFEEKTDLLQVTEEDETSTYTEEGYWYVEMGTYSTTSDNAEGKRESEYLRWRYFSDTTSHYEFNRDTRPTGKGYFILENYYSSYNSTNVGGLYCSWNNDYLNASPYKHQLNGWTDIDANDYSTSTIRQYMNSEEERVQRYYTYSNSIYSPNDPASNMFIDLHIDPDNDIIYTDIIGRTLGDLYTDMTDSKTNPQDVTMPKGSSSGWEGAEITYSEDDTDKFWLLSYYEAYTLLSGNTTTSSDTDREWGDYYWLRSPNSSHSNNACSVITSGNLSVNNGVNYGSNAVRAAFKFSI